MNRALFLVVMIGTGCPSFPGAEDGECNTHQICEPGLSCVEGICLQTENALVMVCEGKECGRVGEIDCGSCSDAQEACVSGRCVDPCIGLECGNSYGVDCGTCGGATDLCKENLCVDVCASIQCGLVEGVPCGSCQPAMELCRSNSCVDCTDGACGYRLIPSGTFMMGSAPEETGHQISEPLHEVTISKPFWLKATELTQSEWVSIMSDNPSYFDCGVDCPVTNVSWGNGVEYMNRLSDLENLDRCYNGSGEEWTFSGLSCSGYRYPTEAEWEYAARATSTTAFSSGPLVSETCVPPDPNLERVAWFCLSYSDGPQTVGLKTPNQWGLYDMHGNVNEWTQDLYDTNYYLRGPSTDPTGPAETLSGNRSVRSGLYWYNPPECRAAKRYTYPPNSLSRRDLGIRPARSFME